MHAPIHRLTLRAAVTLLELLVVVLIISILATIATGIYTGETNRAKIAATVDLIRSLEVAITRYEVDTGQLPPSGSGTLPLIELGPGNNGGRTDGSGYLSLALTHSLSGNAYQPASSLWKGPYISLQADQLRGRVTSSGVDNRPGLIDILDAWGNPILYVKSSEYTFGLGEFSGGTRLFSSSLPRNANPRLPAPNPFIALGETYYNPRTYQLISFGPNGTTLSAGDLATLGFSFKGTEFDDITNFGF